MPTPSRTLGQLTASVALVTLAAAPLTTVAPRTADVLPATAIAMAPADDFDNFMRANGRLEDQYSNPAFLADLGNETLTVYSENIADQLEHPDRPIVTLSQWLPGGRTADPYRQRWEQEGRGIQTEFEYLDRSGVRIQGSLWAPNLPYTDPASGVSTSGNLPAVVITTGSIQGYQEMYLWAAQGLAEAGYLVMTYDVQGQGSSETFAHRPDGTLWCGQDGCPGVPFQQSDNFYLGTEDALDWFVSDANPMFGLLDQSRIALAGHSLGAGAVTNIGNRVVPVPTRPDIKVRAVVGWDNANLSTTDSYTGETLEPRVPTMGQNAEFFFNATPNAPTSNPDNANGTFRRFRDAGVDSYQVALRSSTHLEWTYVPLILPASSEGERVAMHYTLAWMDRHVKPYGMDAGVERTALITDATRRLLLTEFDDSADRSAIGAGTWDLASLSNVPHTLQGEPVIDHLSRYMHTSYAFDGHRCDAVMAGCE